MDYTLTKDADRTLGKIYQAYLEKRKAGVPKSEAKCFVDCAEWCEELFPNESKGDIIEAVGELCRTFQMKMYIDGGFVLSDEAIIYMENRFPNGLSQVLEWMAKIKNAIPFA